MEGLIDRLDPAAEFAPFKGAERLDGLGAIGKAISRVRGLGYLVPGPDLDREGEGVPSREFQRGVRVVQDEVGLLGPFQAAEGKDQPLHGDP